MLAITRTTSSGRRAADRRGTTPGAPLPMPSCAGHRRLVFLGVEKRHHRFGVDPLGTPRERIVHDRLDGIAQRLDGADHRLPAGQAGGLGAALEAFDDLVAEAQAQPKQRRERAEIVLHFAQRRDDGVDEVDVEAARAVDVHFLLRAAAAGTSLTRCGRSPARVGTARCCWLARCSVAAGAASACRASSAPCERCRARSAAPLEKAEEVQRRPAALDDRVVGDGFFCEPAGRRQDDVDEEIELMHLADLQATLRSPSSGRAAPADRRAAASASCPALARRRRTAARRRARSAARRLAATTAASRGRRIAFPSDRPE